MKAILINTDGITETDIENKLEELQEAVGGYIEAVRLPFHDSVMIVNEEGLLLGLKINIIASEIANQPIVGNALILGVDGEEFTDITDDMIKFIKYRFSNRR